MACARIHRLTWGWGGWGGLQTGSRGRRWFAVADGTHNDTSLRNPAAYCREVARWMEEMGL